MGEWIVKTMIRAKRATHKNALRKKADGFFAYLAEEKKARKNAPPTYSLVVSNISEASLRKIEWMTHYLHDVKGYIPVAHPTYLMKFVLNFTMQALIEDIKPRGGRRKKKKTTKR